jgi:hypothetical protein
VLKLTLALIVALSFVPKAHADLACHAISEEAQLFRCAHDAQATFTADGWKTSPAGFVKEADETPDGRPAHSGHLYQCLASAEILPGNFVTVTVTVTYTLRGQPHTDGAVINCLGAPVPEQHPVRLVPL